MRAARLESWGGPEDVRIVEVPEPTLSAHTVLVDVRAASVNSGDLLMVGNRYQVPLSLPFTPGCEFAGVVRAVADPGSPFAPGDRVMGGVMTGAFAPVVVAHEAALAPVPDGLGWPEAAAFRVATTTAYHALVTFGELTAGSCVAVLGAAGGVGSACVQMATMLGARVIGVVSSADKAGYVRSLGAAGTVVHRTEDVLTRLRELAPDGVDVVVDPVGGPLSEPALRALGWGGRFVVVGCASGDVARIPLDLIHLGGAQIRGFDLGTLGAHLPAARAAADGALADLVRDGLRPAIGATYPLADVAPALRHVADGLAVGKVVLTV